MDAGYLVIWMHHMRDIALIVWDTSDLDGLELRI